MNTKDNQRARITRIMLKQAYTSLMHKMPVNRITVKQICETAQVNRSTFYLHYNEPNDVLIELEDEAILQVAESLQSISQFKEAHDDAEKVLLLFLRNVQQHDELFRTFLVENQDPHFRRKLQNYAIKAAETGFDIQLTPSYKPAAYLYIISGSIELLSEWIKSNYEASEKEMADLLYCLCEGSLRSIIEKHHTRRTARHPR